MCIRTCTGTDTPPRGIHIPACTRADTPRADISQHVLGQTPPGQTPPSGETAIAADGTHPTGMHFVGDIFYLLRCNYQVVLHFVAWIDRLCVV